MEWWKKIKPSKLPISRGERKYQMPEGLWIKCDGCKEIIYKKEIVRNLNVCPKCNFHFRLPARERLALLLDEGVYEELDLGIRPTDPLGFKDSKAYKDRLKEYQKRTGGSDALITALGSMEGMQVVICCLDYQFMGGSMGSVVGEKITRAIERCARDRIPLIVVSASGGARMQEGILSLMQMAKIAAALARLDEEKIPFISVLTDPTTGGVTASFRDVGGSQCCRTEGTDRIRWTAGSAADDQHRASGGIPTRRVPLGEGHARHGGRAKGPQGDSRARFALSPAGGEPHGRSDVRRILIADP